MYSELFVTGMVGIAAITDIASRRIPNVLVACGLTIALILHLFAPISGSWQTWLFGALTSFLVFMPFYLLRGMGAGDVKLMVAVGSFVGPLLALKIALATFIIGGMWSLLVIVSKGKARHTLANLRLLMLPLLMRLNGVSVPIESLSYQTVGRLPYGVAIALGTLVILYVEQS